MEDLRREEIVQRLAATGVTDPAKIFQAQVGDDGVAAAVSLVSARSQQFEDWLVLGIFMAFLGGADAFVSAHLRNFPRPVGVQVAPMTGGLNLQLSVPLGGGGQPADNPNR